MNRTSASVLSLIVLAGCVTYEPPPPAVTSFAPAVACTDAPSVSGAASLTPENPAGRMEHVIDVGVQAPCLRLASGAQAPYAVFALPTAGKVASISAGAIFEELRVFAPVVSTLGADGRTVRTFTADDFHRRGQTLAVLFSPRAEEKFLVVSGEPAKVGGAHSLIAVDPAGVSVPGHIKSPEQVAAFKANLSRPYSYAGQVFARAYFADPVAK